MKANDVTSQRVFTFRGAKRVLQRCKEEQKEMAKVRGRRGASKIKRAGREERASSLLIANN